MFLSLFAFSSTQSYPATSELTLDDGVVIEKISQNGSNNLNVHIKDIVILTLEGNYANTYLSNLDAALSRNGLTRKDLTEKVQEFKRSEMCQLVYHDPTVSPTKTNTVKTKVGFPYFVDYSAEELQVTQGPRVPFSIQSSSNISYDDRTHYRIYLPEGRIKGVVFDIYGGGLDRFYYPIYVASSDVPASKEYNTITLYKRFFRGFLKRGIAVVTLRLADCRVQIRDPFNTYYSDDPFVVQKGNRLALKHQAFYIGEMSLIKREIKNFLNYFPDICPQAKGVPKIFIGMSFGGLVGQFIVQDKTSENWFDHYIFLHTPTYEFKGIVGDTIYDILEQQSYLEHKVFFIFGALDNRIQGGHDTSFMQRVRNKNLVKVQYLQGVGHHLPYDPRSLIDDIVRFCGLG
ncbi:MAG: hypothetical protein H6850_01730 [Alphaproteobacteria bacterium]|nr:MAG: hypothetical protein H6850_01730 [Alphaproteobacteria bacterium]